MINNKDENPILTAPLKPKLISPLTLIDTHCHINVMIKEKFDTLLKPEEFELAKQIEKDSELEGIKYILNVGTSIVECINCINLAKQNKNMFAAVGIHHCDITSDWKSDLKKIREFLTNKEENKLFTNTKKENKHLANNNGQEGKRFTNKIVCIGECGLDMYHRQDTIAEQKDLLKAQIELALEYKLTLSIHMRQATEQMHYLLEEFKKDNLTGVMHCFPENKEFADYVIGLGLLVGIGGPITYPKNITLQETVAHIALDKIILETDAPYLPPQSIRGKQNHPKYIVEIAKQVAKIKNVSFEEVAEQTTKNALNLFKFDKFTN